MSVVVPLTTELLLGITPTQPGFTEIALNPAADLPWSYQATVPTPFGPISVEKESPMATTRYCVPKEIKLLTGPVPVDVRADS